MKRNLFYEFLQSVLLKAGVRISRNYPFRDPLKLMKVKAEELGIETMLDVGANVGQFVQMMRAEGYQGKMLSFEPLSAAHVKLTEAAARDPNWHVAPRMAVGDVPGETTINVSQNLTSSSLLRMEARFVEVEPISGYCSEEKVEVVRLDDALTPEFPGPFALKLDTQGFELHVLRGAPKTLERCRLLMLEISLVPLYAGSPKFSEIMEHLEKAGFRAISITQGTSDVARNEVLQVDGIFVRA
jgi:FkbM family methyltransferase